MKQSVRVWALTVPSLCEHLAIIFPQLRHHSTVLDMDLCLLISLESVSPLAWAWVVGSLCDIQGEVVLKERKIVP